jgi:hypothetical protein
MNTGQHWFKAALNRMGAKISMRLQVWATGLFLVAQRSL